MATLEELRKKRLEELMNAQSQQKNQQADEQAKLQQQVELMENAVRQVLTKEALERYGNIKAAHKETALQLVVGIFQAVQKGQIGGKIDDATLKQILEQITPKKKEIKIKRI